MTDEASLTMDLVIAQGEGQVSTVVDGKAVLMSVDNGKYYNMCDIGTRIWVLIETPTTHWRGCDQMVQEYEVERGACEADVLALLTKLLANDLIRIVSS